MQGIVERAEASGVHGKPATDRHGVLAAVRRVSLFPARLTLDVGGAAVGVANL